MGKKNSNPQTMGKKNFRPQKKGEKVPKSTNPGLAPLPVAATTWAIKFIEDFRNSGKDSQVIEQNLTNSERGIIHQVCRQQGLGSKSHGKGDERRLSIFIKDEKKDARGQNKGIPIVKKKSAEVKKCVSFPPEAKAALHELFTRYPPCDSDTTGTSLGLYTGNFISKHKDDFFLKPQLKKDDIKMKVARLAVAADKRCREIFEVRAKLPIASFRDTIVSAVESNQVVLIAGETGCGKTTQVPQYLLDHMWSKQEACKIICTQPRRISAISVSERISWERGENIGENVGYKVRLESEGGRWSSVVFCTNGILLRVLVGKGVNSCVPDITHIIVDEIHERDCYSDFMLAILRDLLPSNPHLRLILMSATLDAKRFSEYFGGCPVVRVPGFTYPVRTFFLEDALSVLKSDENNHILSADSTIPGGKRDFNEEDKVALGEAIDLAWKNDEFDALLDLVSSEECHEAYNYQKSTTGLTPLMVFAGKGRVSEVCKLLSFGADYKLESKEGITALVLAEKENQFETAQIIKEHKKNIQSKSQQAKNLLNNYMAKINPDAVDVGLIVDLMKKICVDSEEGAILVFLPGWEEIVQTKEKLLVDPFFSKRFSIICLHSKVPAAEQKKVFNHTRPGCRKIVLSTNIAESAITIEDVVFVIDSGRMKEKSYDPYNDVSTLQSSWVSKANAKQREGRAGRCQPGICYHLYSKLRAASLPEFRVPEVRRMPVDELCLQVKMLDPSCNVNVFLQKLMDPPVAQSIANALTILQDIGALTPQEELTELGHKFGQLPVHPRISKMLYFAILVNCLDPALILACAADTKDPFIMPLLAGEKQKAAAAKHELASLYGDHSDHLAIVAAFQCWENAKESGRDNEFCSKYFLSPFAMTMLDSLRLKLQGELRRHGVIPSSSNCSLNAHDPGILRAVVAVGLYPMLGRMCPLSNTQRISLVETITGAKVRVLSLNKVNMSSSKYDEALIIFDEITQGDRDLHIRSCTLLPTIPLLLFSREIAVSPTESYDADKSDDEEDHEVENVGDAMDIDKAGGRPEDKIMLVPDNSVKVVVDRWLPFKVTAFEIAQMYILRQRLMASILFKVKHPNENLPPHLCASMYAIASILSYGDVTQPSVKTVAVKPVASVVDAMILRDDIPSASPSEIQEHDPNTTPMGSMLESANTSGLVNMEESLPSTLANGSEQPDPNTALMEAVSVATQQKKMQSSSKKCKSVNNVDLGNIEENLRNMEENKPSDLANNGNEQTMPKSASNLDTVNLEENKPSDLADGNAKTELNPAKLLDLENMEDNTLSDLANGNVQKEPKSVNNLDLKNMKNNTPSDLANGNEQIDNTTPMESASAGKQPKKRQSRSKRCESVNHVDLGSMEESMKNNTPSDLGNGNEQTEPNTALLEAPSAAKRSKKRHSKSKRHKLVNNDDLGNMEENTTSDLANGNEQTEPKSVNNLDLENIKNKTPSDLANLNEQTESNTAQVEAASVDKQPKKKQSRSKRRKSVTSVDLGNMEEDTPSDLANGNVQAEPNSASNLGIGNTKDNVPSYLVNGNEQTEPKSVINLDLGNVEEKMPSDLANGNEKTEPKSTNKLDYGNMEESLPSNLTSGDEQPDPNTAPMEVVSAANQPEKKRPRSKKRKSANNVDLGNIEEKKPSDLANGNEQPDPNIAPEEAASAPKQPKKKHSRSKRRKLADNLESEVASIAEQQKDEVQTEPKSGNKSDLIEEKVSIPPDHVKGNEQSDPNTGPTEAA
ncbi:DExH-box ATP-dependent RNA helicase DExH2 [Cardamine amara subsp. amara]|uniref:RNA helicase n=1 Tax=Cardamine amara subsp. amara TaxID=228776 RepID=A0ABD1A5R6_CARAN